MLVKVLHQSQHLNELAAPAILHPRFHQPSQTINAIGEAPFVQRRGLIERLALLFQQGEVMQGIVDKLGPVIAADMGSDRLASTNDLDPVDVALRQNLLMAVARRNRGPSETLHNTIADDGNASDLTRQTLHRRDEHTFLIQIA
jgi:hypothetical protein